MAERIIIANGTLVTPQEVVQHGTLVIEGGRIAEVSERRVPRSDPGVIDAGGKLVVPGFIDLHVQGCCGHDVWEADPSAVRAMAESLVRFGTTAFLATTEYNPPGIAAIRSAMADGCPGAQPLGLHIEGPFVSPRRLGAIPESYCWRPSVSALEGILQTTGPDLRLMVVAPEVEWGVEIVRELAAAGVRVAIGHSDATQEQAAAGIEAGISHATHLFNAMRGIGSADIGVAGTVLTHDEVTAELVADCIHVHPAMLALAVKLKGPHGIALISDAIRATGLPDGVYRHRENDEELHVHDGAVRLRDGTIAGSTLTLNRAICNMVRRADVPLREAVTMATHTPARILDLAESKGALQAGMDGDIAILDNAFEVWMTLVRGRIVHAEGATGCSSLSEAGPRTGPKGQGPTRA